jgi:hypothetical protein
MEERKDSSLSMVESGLGGSSILPGRTGKRVKGNGGSLLWSSRLAALIESYGRHAWIKSVVTMERCMLSENDAASLLSYAKAAYVSSRVHGVSSLWLS